MLNVHVLLTLAFVAGTVRATSDCATLANFHWIPAGFPDEPSNVCCQLATVGCNSQWQIVNLTMSYAGISGPLPMGLSQLKTLEHLELSYNNINGPLDALASLTRLTYLALAGNSFEGHNLRQLSNLTALQYLILNSSGLVGSIAPLYALSALVYLDLCDNSFSGQVSSLARMPRLAYLDLDSNQFSGMYI